LPPSVSKSAAMARHGDSAAIALALVLLGSLAQIFAAGRIFTALRPRPVSATVVNVVAPAGVLFATAACGYLHLAGGHHGTGRVTTVLVAAALVASAAYTAVVTLVALAVAVAAHGLRQVWSSVWVVTAASVTCVAVLPLVLHP
jgi:hypothetical protein